MILAAGSLLAARIAGYRDEFHAKRRMLSRQPDKIAVRHFTEGQAPLTTLC